MLLAILAVVVIAVFVCWYFKPKQEEPDHVLISNGDPALKELVSLLPEATLWSELNKLPVYENGDKTSSYIFATGGEWSDDKISSLLKRNFPKIRNADLLILEPEAQIQRQSRQNKLVHVMLTEHAVGDVAIWVEGSYLPGDDRYYAAIRNYSKGDVVTFNATHVYALKNTSDKNAVILALEFW